MIVRASNFRLAWVALLLATALLAVCPVHADAGDGPWVVTVIKGKDHLDPLPGAIYTVDTAANTLYGPFLQGQLGTPAGELLDVAVTANCTTALVSNLGDQKVFFVDVTHPTSPYLLGSVDLPMFAEDIAITPSCEFALITDGGFSNQLASVNVATRTLVEARGLGSNVAQAVAIAPDGTVIVADYWHGQVHTLTIDGSGNLTPVTSYVLPSTPAQALPWPVNVGVAPDGQTVIVCYAQDDSVGVYQITSPGILTFRGNVSGLPAVSDAFGNVVSGQQSVAFSADGSQACVITNELYTPPPELAELPDRISVLDITAPGEVSLNATGAATLLSHSNVGTPPLYGVDVLAVAGSKLYVGNPTTDDPVNDLQVVDLTDYSVSSLPVGALEGEAPMGVASFAPATLTVEMTGAGTGRVRGDPTACDPGGIYCGADCTETYCTGTVVTLTAHPGVSSYFVGWGGDCSSTELTTQVTMDADKTCIATFGYPVGGIVVPVNRLELLSPWLALASLTVLTVALIRRRRSA
jgi:hypothetical protein